MSGENSNAIPTTFDTPEGQSKAMLGNKPGIEIGRIPLETTIGNNAWVIENTEKIKNILPETWTHISNINGLKLGFDMKLIGIDWRNQDEFGKVMVFFEKAKIMERNGLLVRRSPN